MKMDDFINSKLTEFEKCSNSGGHCTARMRFLTSFEKFLLDELYKHEVLSPEFKKLPPAELKPNKQQ